MGHLLKCLVYFLGFLPAALGAASLEPLLRLEPLPLQLQLDIKDLEPEGWSMAPFLGRDDKNGWVYGAGLFFYRDQPTGYHLDLYGVSNFSDFYSGTVAHEHWMPGPWRYGTQTTVERAFDYYYGEGNMTLAQRPLRVTMDHVAFKGTALHRVAGPLAMGVLADYRRRQEWKVERVGGDDGTEPQYLFPEESGSALGGVARWDNRDSRLFPSKGFYVQGVLRNIPDLWTILDADRGLWQAELEGRTYHSPRPGWVLATRMMGGTSLGNPGYLWRFRLGGVELMRGYGDNRFRGRHFYCGQTELRFPIYKILTGAVGADAGDVGDPGFGRTRFSGQVGLRLALPPDWGQRARFDFGLGEDQHSFNVQFGEVF
jgi:hypothetical protein